MPLFRNEFNKNIIRLRLVKDDLLDKGFLGTAHALSEVISLLDKADSIYIQELAAKNTSSQSRNGIKRQI